MKYLFISNPGEDYQDVVYYAFRKTYGDEVAVWPDKPIYFEAGMDNADFRNCHYHFAKSHSCDIDDIISSIRSGMVRGIFIISSGYRVWPDWEQLRSSILAVGLQPPPVVIIDGADGDRIQYSPSDYSLYFSREFHMGPTKHEPEHYPEHQRTSIARDGKPGPRVFPLPFSIIPEKFRAWNDRSRLGYRRDVFFRGAYGRQRASYLGGLSIHNSLIDINSHTPIDRQDRQGFFDLIETSKINLNITAGGNDCMRFWELFGACGFVLSEQHNQIIEPPYLNGIHLDRFSSREEMLDKIAFYLEHEDLREQIRKQGYDFTMNNHTCYHRMSYIIQKAKEYGFDLS